MHVTCYFTNNAARLTRLFQFGHQRFSHAVAGQFFVVFRQEAMDFILILVYQISFDLGLFTTLRYSGPLSFLPSGRLDNQSLKRRTGSVFPPSVEYMAFGVVLRDIVRPPLRVLVGLSRNSTTSLPSSCCLMTKSST